MCKKFVCDTEASKDYVKSPGRGMLRGCERLQEGGSLLRVAEGQHVRVAGAQEQLHRALLQAPATRGHLQPSWATDLYQRFTKE